jgi:AcrR family transcriptional regulator
VICVTHEVTAGGASQGSRGAGLTARDRARAQITREIRDEALRQVAADGAQRLSLRAVARSLGMVSSALYRYFPSRDDLLTALIVDAYEALSAGAEAAVAARPRSDFRGRWRACCQAIRGWALAHPHEYALIYGSPVPGYQAPTETIAPAGRVAAVLGVLISDACQADPAIALAARRQPLPGQLAAQADAVAEAMAPGVPAPVIARVLIAWTQLFGMISLELFGQLGGSARPGGDFFGYATEQMADLMGLPA